MGVVVVNIAVELLVEVADKMGIKFRVHVPHQVLQEVAQLVMELRVLT